MGELIDLNSQIPDSRIPAAIARDSETTAAINAHVAAADPHPVYLTQAEGNILYRRSAVALIDEDIPVGVARDSETTAAINAHVAANDPHPGKYVLAKVLSFTTPLTGQGIVVPHGLSFSRIVGFFSVLESAPNAGLIPPNTTSAGFQYVLSADATNVNFGPGPGPSAGVPNKTVRVVIFYIA